MDGAGTLTMSRNELNRLEILRRVLECRLTQTQAAEQLGLGVCRVERLCRKLRVEGPPGLLSKKRGRASNRRLPDEIHDRALDWVPSSYHDFGPTLAAEKLRQQHDVTVSVETFRKWMIGAEPSDARHWTDVDHAQVGTPALEPQPLCPSQVFVVAVN